MIFSCELQCLMLTMVTWDLSPLSSLLPAPDTSQRALPMTDKPLILCVRAAFTLCFRSYFSQGGAFIGFTTFFQFLLNLRPVDKNDSIKQLVLMAVRFGFWQHHQCLFKSIYLKQILCLFSCFGRFALQWVS